MENSVQEGSRQHITPDVRSGTTRITGSETKPVEIEADYEETSRQRSKTRVSTSTKLPGTNRVTPPPVTPIIYNGASMEETMARIVEITDEQSEQMSLRKSELGRAVHIETENPRDNQPQRTGNQ